MSRLLLVFLLAAAMPQIERAPIIRVPAGGDLQKALDSAPAGAVITLAPGTVYMGTFVLPAHRGDHWITLTTEGTLAERRVTPAQGGRLAVLRSPSAEPAIRTAPGARRWRVIGVEIAPNARVGGTAVEIGNAEAIRVDDLASEIVLDRLLVRGDPVRGQKRGIGLHGRAITLTRSHVADFKLDGQEAQAVYSNNGPGPYTITDNYLEGSAQSVLVGGDTPRLANVIPSDILVEGNTLAKPFEWQRQPWDVKALFELKNARRVVIRGNLFSGNWVSAQAGYAILFTPRNQYGDAPWTIVEDVLLEGNVIKDVSSAINILGEDDKHSSQRTNRIVIRQNLAITDKSRFGGDGRFLMIGRVPQSLTIEQNTSITNGSAWIYTYGGGSVKTTAGLIVRNNLALHNRYGFMSDAGAGRRALATYYPDAVFTGNVLAAGRAKDYPEGNLFPSVTHFLSQFVDAASGDYRLNERSDLAGRGALIASLPTQ
jgi:Right handed beta helix region